MTAAQIAAVIRFSGFNTICVVSRPRNSLRVDRPAIYAVYPTLGPDTTNNQKAASHAALLSAENPAHIVAIHFATL